MSKVNFDIKKGINVHNGRFIADENEVSIDGEAVAITSYVDTAILAESSNRIDADAILQDNIDAISSHVDTAILIETNNRIDADAILQANIDAVVNDIPTAISNGIDTLTSAEVTQLGNIDTTTISGTQWGYIGTLNQSLTTTGNVQFNSMTSPTITATSIVTASGSNLILDPTGPEINLIGIVKCSATLHADYIAPFALSSDLSMTASSGRDLHLNVIGNKTVIHGLVEMSSGLTNTGTIEGAEKWNIITGDGIGTPIVASANNKYMVDTTTTGEQFTFTGTPPVIGTTLTFSDMKGTFATNNCQVVLNTVPFEGTAAPNTVMLNVDNTTTQFIYTGPVYGWKSLTF